MAGTGSAFDQEQFKSIYPEGVERHYWNRCRNRVIARMLRRMGAHGPMLEVGCGKGLVVAALGAMGHDITGVDIAQVDPVAAAAGRVRAGTDAFDLPGEERQRYRTLLLLDVIEHLEDPPGFVRRLSQAFPSVEWIIVTVPARQELFSAHDTFNRHLRRYDLGLLRRHLDPRGDRPLNAAYFFHGLYPLAWLQARLSKQRRRFNAPAPGLPSLLHGVLAALLYAEHRMLPGSWPGTSIIAALKAR